MVAFGVVGLLRGTILFHTPGGHEPIRGLQQDQVGVVLDVTTVVSHAAQHDMMLGLCRIAMKYVTQHRIVELGARLQVLRNLDPLVAELTDLTRRVPEPFDRYEVPRPR